MGSSNIINYGPPIESTTKKDHTAIAAWLLGEDITYRRDTIKSLILGQNFAYTEAEFQKVLQIKIGEMQGNGGTIDIKKMIKRLDSLNARVQAKIIRKMIEDIMQNNSIENIIPVSPASI